MKISRYIKFPLIFGLLIMLYSLFFSFEPSLYKLFTAFSVGAIIGLILQFLNDLKTRQTESEAEEQNFATHQTRTISLLCSFEKAFELCLESVGSLKNGKIDLADKEHGYVKAKTGINLKSFGNTVEFKLKAITENLTEVQISTKPSVPTTLIDYGESVETIKNITEFFESKNEDLNYQTLENKSDISSIINTNDQNDVKIAVK